MSTARALVALAPVDGATRRAAVSPLRAHRSRLQQRGPLVKGLGLYDGVLAVIVLLAEDIVERPDTEPVRPFAGGLLAEWERTSLRPGVRALGIVDKYDATEARDLEEDYAVRWATAYPADIVMVVEVLG